jgi:hypothetical protein
MLLEAYDQRLVECNVEHQSEDRTSQIFQEETMMDLKQRCLDWEHLNGHDNQFFDTPRYLTEHSSESCIWDMDVQM